MLLVLTTISSSFFIYLCITIVARHRLLAESCGGAVVVNEVGVLAVLEVRVESGGEVGVEVYIEGALLLPKERGVIEKSIAVGIGTLDKVLIPFK